MRKYIDIITEANRLIEGLDFNGTDPQLDRAFGILCDALNIHESAHQNLAYKLMKQGQVVKRLDPRDPLNKWTPQQWKDLGSKVGKYFHVTVENNTLTIADATNPTVGQ